MKGGVQLYKSLFSKSFFFDKFSFDNVYQCPRISGVEVKFILSSQLEFKVKFCKKILMFYLLTGQKPKILIKNCNLRGSKRKKIVGLFITLQNYDFFLNFLVLRQLALIPFFQPFQLNRNSGIVLNINQKTHDDDILFQVLKITGTIKYQVYLNTTSLYKFHLQTLLTNFKIPC